MTRWATKAIVLRSEAAGESDRRVILLTPGQGRVSALAKGALKSLKRFAGLFDRFELLSVGLMIGPRTNRVMIAEQTTRGITLGPQIASEIQARLLDHLDHEILQVAGGRASPTVSAPLNRAALAGKTEVAAAMRRLVAM